MMVGQESARQQWRAERTAREEEDQLRTRFGNILLQYDSKFVDWEWQIGEIADDCITLHRLSSAFSPERLGSYLEEHLFSLMALSVENRREKLRNWLFTLSGFCEQVVKERGNRMIAPEDADYLLSHIGLIDVRQLKLLFQQKRVQPIHKKKREPLAEESEN